MADVSEGQKDMNPKQEKDAVDALEFSMRSSAALRVEQANHLAPARLVGQMARELISAATGKKFINTDAMPTSLVEYAIQSAADIWMHLHDVRNAGGDALMQSYAAGLGAMRDQIVSELENPITFAGCFAGAETGRWPASYGVDWRKEQRRMDEERKFLDAEQAELAADMLAAEADEAKQSPHTIISRQTGKSIGVIEELRQRASANPGAEAMTAMFLGGWADSLKSQAGEVQADIPSTVEDKKPQLPRELLL